MLTLAHSGHLSGNISHDGVVAALAVVAFLSFIGPIVRECRHAWRVHFALLNRCKLTWSTLRIFRNRNS